MPIHTVIFDLDGTLVDSLPGISQAIQKAVAEVTPGADVPELSCFLGPPVREVFRRALAIEDEGLLGRLEGSFRRHYDGGDWMQTRTFPGAPETLGALRTAGCRLFVVTNKPRLPTERILRHLKLWDRFEAVVTPASREPFYESKSAAAADLQRQRGFAAEEALMVGDSEDDAQAAQFCGFWFAAITFGYGQVHLRPRSLKWVPINSFTDIMAFIQRS